LKLAEYIQELLVLIGSSHVRVHDSLDGRPVVHYQAVVSVADWESVESQLEIVMNVQRAYYRRTYGGTQAPSLKIDVDARHYFEDTAPKQLSKPFSQEIPVRGTFVHFGMGPQVLAASSRLHAHDDILMLQCGVVN